MSEMAPSLTPPNKAQKAPKAEKVAKPAGEKKDRAPRKDYGFHADAKIHLTTKETKYRGQRKDYFDLLVKYDNRKVSDFLEAAKDRKDPPRGWLRFFVDDGAVTLEKPAV